MQAERRNSKGRKPVWVRCPDCGLWFGWGRDQTLPRRCADCEDDHRRGATPGIKKRGMA